METVELNHVISRLLPFSDFNKFLFNTGIRGISLCFKTVNIRLKLMKGEALPQSRYWRGFYDSLSN
jgi:hypothetical protein